MIPPGFREIDQADPFTITVPATARSLFTGIADYWVESFLIRVRSMGTATYIAIGGINAREYRLTGLNQIYGYNCPLGSVLNLSKIWIISDTADAVIEVIATEYVSQR